MNTSPLRGPTGIDCRCGATGASHAVSRADVPDRPERWYGVLDLIFLALTVALFVVLGLAVRGVERL